MAKQRTFAKEANVKNAVKVLLKKHQWFWWMPAANGFGKSGVSDFIAVKNGVILAIETKFGKNKPTVLQLKFLNDLVAQRGLGFVVDETNVDALGDYFSCFDIACQKLPLSTDVESRLHIALRRLTERIP